MLMTLRGEQLASDIAQFGDIPTVPCPDSFVEVLFSFVAVHISQVRHVYQPDRFSVFSLDASSRVLSAVLCYARDELSKRGDMVAVGSR